MTLHRYKDTVCILGIDQNRCYLLSVRQAQMRPSLARVSRFINAIARRQIGPLQTLTAPDINNVRIGRSNSDCANRTRILRIKNRLPGVARIGGLPHTTVSPPLYRKDWADSVRP